MELKNMPKVAQEFTERALSEALFYTRQELEGITIERVAEVIKQHYCEAEIKDLIKYLNGKQ